MTYPRQKSDPENDSHIYQEISRERQENESFYSFSDRNIYVRDDVEHNPPYEEIADTVPNPHYDEIKVVSEENGYINPTNNEMSIVIHQPKKSKETAV